jgi:hypothetical protein
MAAGGNNPVPKREQTAMTDQNTQARDDLTTDELAADLESVSGGRNKIPLSDAVKTWEIVKIERDNPGF